MNLSNIAYHFCFRFVKIRTSADTFLLEVLVGTSKFLGLFSKFLTELLLVVINIYYHLAILSICTNCIYFLQNKINILGATDHYLISYGSHSLIFLEMEWNIENSPDRGLPTNSGDIKYLSGLSTILVATIQEAKDRISQVEYIFCTQLFPNIQSKFKIYSEAIKTVEDAWKKKENDLLLQIESLKLEKQQALGENQSLKLEKATLLEEKEEKTNPLLTKLQSLEKEVGVLKRELLQKSKEVDEGMELQNKLIQLIEKKSSAILTKGKQLKEQEEKKSEVVARLQSLEKKVDELQQKLKEKTEEIVKGKELQENLFKKIESQDSKMMSNQFLLNDHEKEMKLLIDQIKHLKKNADELQTELQKRNEEVEEGRKLQEHLLKQIDLNGLNTLKNEQQLEEHEKKEKMLLTKIKGLEERVNELQVEVNGKSNEVTDGGEWHQNFLQQIELKSSELLSEKKKRRDVVAAYKKLKSQYNFLSSKLGLTTENVLTPVKIEEENNSLMHHVNPLNSPGEILLPFPFILIRC